MVSSLLAQNQGTLQSIAARSIVEFHHLLINVGYSQPSMGHAILRCESN